MLAFLEACLRRTMRSSLNFMHGRRMRYDGQFRGLEELVRGLIELSDEALAPSERFGFCRIIKKVAPKEAINVMNESLYGLTASVWIEDATAAERIGSGIGFMNRCDDANPGPDRRQGHWQGASMSRRGFEALTPSYHLRLEH